VKANPLALTDLPYYPSLTMVSVTVYDGARTIGGNKILVEEGGRGVFLDFGKNFGKYAVYF
jgi:ribonuclease J